MGTQEDRAEVIRLQDEWMQAWIRRDRETLERILGEGFTLTSVTTDDLVDRAEWLRAAFGRIVGKEFHYDAFRVQLYGDTAVVRSRAHQRAEIDGRPWDREFLITDVWVRRGGQWQVVARHSSRPSGVSARGLMGSAG